MDQAVTATVAAERIELRAWQQEALDAWNAAGRRAVVEAVTGTGKTTLGIVAAAEALSRGLSVLVVVPGIDLLDQWYRAIRKALPGRRVGRRGAGSSDSFANSDILVSTVQSAIQRNAPMPTSPALLVADEVHRYGALTFSRLLTEEFTERLGLTATFERTDDGVEQHLLPYFEAVISGCDYDRGHRDGILAPVRVMLVAVPFSEAEQGTYSELDETAKRERGNLIHKYGCTGEPFGEFMRDVQQLSEGGADRATWAARNYLRAFSQRRALLAAAAGKLETVRELGGVLAQTGRSILFSETKESSRAAAEVLLEEGVLAAPYTSDLSRTDRTTLLGAFKSGAMKALIAPKVLDEGVDVPEADVGVILASSKSRRQMIQRMGRIIRPKQDGRHASFLVLFAKGSSEDPDLGAHGTFLEQLTGIASELITVDADQAADVLRDWLGGDESHDGSSTDSTDAVYRETAERLVGEAEDSLEPGTVTAGSELLAVLSRVAENPRADDVDIVLTGLSVLEPDQVGVVILRFGLGGHRPMSQSEVAAALALTAVDVGRTEAAAMSRLEKPDVADVLANLL
ncbi:MULTISPECIES: DEAD/DEAH box helicase [unclassified Rhodococcus (in: high G+C Gram-positive bacteria)]|uniref:DEAD/DEAH box helicase n=1 Tax=unclassified Rhodococcus (in: high G+C Gram-positive bacteria) TaxID=192944 RepID=UPI00163A61D1|nr:MULTISPECIES: DEAD/DEAH box helicase [unclassified Rhodococcus (in: high G+C Gram-positive bacteria)]MBC2639081.1 DEAD/DEAH box helicase [Rhodococcus sp. 3A]MBC2896177.1 DEAD/DEAH box helicase [Rhodococcus sp. 4CII]